MIVVESKVVGVALVTLCRAGEDRALDTFATLSSPWKGVGGRNEPVSVVFMRCEALSHTYVGG